MCDGLQLDEDDILYHDSDRRPLKIVYPPQPLEEDLIIAGGLNDTAIIDLTIKVYPLPYYSQVIWTIQREDLTEQVSLATNIHHTLSMSILQIQYDLASDQYSMNISDDGFSRLFVSLQVTSLQDLDYDSKHSLLITNSVGSQEYPLLFTDTR